MVTFVEVAPTDSWRNMRVLSPEDTGKYSVALCDEQPLRRGKTFFTQLVKSFETPQFVKVPVHKEVKATEAKNESQNQFIGQHLF